MATIVAIDDRTVHQIQSGQVIVDLCSVVKELVENSLDAGATSIEIRFRNQGLESIEVQDNGAGISPDNYKSVALKHHTSKLASYIDLSTLETFGFRGEALSSLCNLSRFTITTCMASDAPKGTKLDFDQSGNLLTTSVVAAQKGTTVSVENLFHNLPVRRRELERNIKREWTRVINVLGQYACIQVGVKLSVSQVNVKGKKTSLFATKGNLTTRDNIVNVFGAKTMTALVKLDLMLELEPSAGIGPGVVGSDSDASRRQVKIAGHISRPAYGEGRQTPDRQMFFVNSRPCGLPQVAKTFNEVYKMYNSHQSPFIFANIAMDTHSYDVNVSPDKRTILLHDQSRMLEHLKTALIELFDSQDHTIPVSQTHGPRQTPYRQLTLAAPHSLVKMSSSIETSQSSSAEELESDNVRTRGASGIASDDAEYSDEDGEEAYIPKRITAVSQSRSRDERATNLLDRLRSRKAPAQEEASNEEQPESHMDDESHDSDVEEELQSTTMHPASLKHVEERLITQSGESSSSSDPTYQVPIPVRDFNARLAELAAQRSAKPANAYHRAVEEADVGMSSSLSGNSESDAPILPDHYERHRGPPETVAAIVEDEASTRIPSTDSFAMKKVAKHAPALTLPSFGKTLGQHFSMDRTDTAQGIGEENTVEQGHNNAHAVTFDDEIQDSAREDVGMFVDDQSQPSPVLHRPDAQSSLDDIDPEYLDDDDKKALEDAKVQEMIRLAEQDAVRPVNENAKRTQNLLKGRVKVNGTSTVSLKKTVTCDIKDIKHHVLSSTDAFTNPGSHRPGRRESEDALDSKLAEEKLSLTITKSDFSKMNIIGQFNLGFILATRTNDPAHDTNTFGDDLFIIDQHASDEKYNFERLQSTTIVQSQRLVQSKTLDLTAMEEEIVMENISALEQNGFIVSVDDSGDEPVGRRCSLLSLPLSRETAFSLRDLEELIALLAEHPSGTLPRPSRVRKMFAMRACRSSIMIGKTLTGKQMRTVVRHMGEIDKPWNCPHGRPTMRHLCALDAWDETGWKEGMGMDGEKARVIDWAIYAGARSGKALSKGG